MVSLPAKGDTTAFEKNIEDAKAAGAVCVRSAALSGRRYETFATLADWQRFVDVSHRAIEAAIPILEKHRMPLALENHKDWTADEMAALMKKYSSEYLGVCLDFGNNIALLDDPMTVVETLAPFVLSTHMKDMGVEWSNDGFLLSEMVLGRGFLDLPRMVSTIRKARPATRFSLEMITRDPLRFPASRKNTGFPSPTGTACSSREPCNWYRNTKARLPLPRVSTLSHAAQLTAEDENVKQSIAFVREKLEI